MHVVPLNTSEISDGHTFDEFHRVQYSLHPTIYSNNKSTPKRDLIKVLPLFAPNTLDLMPLPPIISYVNQINFAQKMSAK